MTKKNNTSKTAQEPKLTVENLQEWFVQNLGKLPFPQTSPLAMPSWIASQSDVIQALEKLREENMDLQRRHLEMNHEYHIREMEQRLSDSNKRHEKLARRNELLVNLLQALLLDEET